MIEIMGKKGLGASENPPVSPFIKGGEERSKSFAKGGKVTRKREKIIMQLHEADRL